MLQNAEITTEAWKRAFRGSKPPTKGT